jgi:hypothetical protein
MRTMIVIMLMMLVAATGCPPKTPYNGPIEYVGGADPHPGVPVEQPAPALAAASRCELVTAIAPLEPFYGKLPAGTTEDEFYSATLQFLNSVGDTVVNQDPTAHTIVTARRDGQTLLSTCKINRYLMYAVHVTIIGRHVNVTMQCWTSTGWESSSNLPRNRGELKPCDVPAYVSKNDAKLPSMVFEGSVAVLDLRSASRSDPLPPPTVDEISGARWWCLTLGRGSDGSCDRSRDTCERSRVAGVERGDYDTMTECRPSRRAMCFEMRYIRLGGSVLSCHPTDAACRGQLDYNRTKRTDDAWPTGECHLVE